MRITFGNESIPERFVKAMTKVLPGLKHSEAQKVVARMFGYRDWHQLVYETRRPTGGETDFWSLAPWPSDSFVPADSFAQAIPSRFWHQLNVLEEMVMELIPNEASIEALRRIYRKAHGGPLQSSPRAYSSQDSNPPPKINYFALDIVDCDFRSLLGEPVNESNNGKPWHRESTTWAFTVDSCSIWGTDELTLERKPFDLGRWLIMAPTAFSAARALDVLQDYADAKMVGCMGAYYFPRPSARTPTVKQGLMNGQVMLWPAAPDRPYKDNQCTPYSANWLCAAD
jgi:hypothetical protein